MWSRGRICLSQVARGRQGGQRGETTMAGNWSRRLKPDCSKPTFRILSACFCCRSVSTGAAASFYVGRWEQRRIYRIYTSPASSGRRWCERGGNSLSLPTYFSMSHIKVDWICQLFCYLSFSNDLMLQGVDIPYTSSLGLFEENILWKGFINTKPIDEST